MILERRLIGSSEVVVTRPERFADAAAAILAEALGAGAARPLSVALSGGSTPGPVYERLGPSEAVAWERIRIYFADERAVSPDDAASNYGLVRHALLDRLSRLPESVHRMEGESADLQAAAFRYDRLLPERLDVLVLGIGEDGHTASLFPGSSNVLESNRRVVVAESPTSPRMRLTITPPVIRSAGRGRVLLFAQGRQKAVAVSEALAGSAGVLACPARLARGGTWVLDADAAASLA